MEGARHDPQPPSNVYYMHTELPEFERAQNTYGTSGLHIGNLYGPRPELIRSQAQGSGFDFVHPAHPVHSRTLGESQCPWSDATVPATFTLDELNAYPYESGSDLGISHANLRQRRLSLEHVHPETFPESDPLGDQAPLMPLQAGVMAAFPERLDFGNVFPPLRLADLTTTASHGIVSDLDEDFAPLSGIDNRSWAALGSDHNPTGFRSTLDPHMALRAEPGSEASVPEVRESSRASDLGKDSRQLQFVTYGDREPPRKRTATVVDLTSNKVCLLIKLGERPTYPQFSLSKKRSDTTNLAESKPLSVL